MKQIAAICDAHHIPFCAHNPSGPVANAGTLTNIRPPDSVKCCS